MNLQFDFTVDKATATIYITREFAADLDLVWDAWTKSEILDQWIAPKPLRAKTKVMDFREGGRWLYAMISAENVTLGYSLAEFVEIKPRQSFSTRNSFSDENGNPISTGFTKSLTTNTFTAEGDTTTVRVVKKMDSLEQLEQFIKMGYKEGFGAALLNLDEYLLNITSNQSLQK